jgi:hypothetical protein
MRLIVLASSLAGFVLLGGCYFMTPGGSAAARWAALDSARAAKANPTAGEKICKSMTPTGSIMPQKICSTQQEWDAFEAETAKTADKFNEYRRSGSTEPGTEGAQFNRN